MIRFTRRRLLTLVLAAAAAGAAMPVAARAQGARVFVPQPRDAAWIGRIEAYLNTITTLRARFLQVASTGEIAHGTFYMRRPGLLRIQYDPPAQMLILADGQRLIYVDKELDSVNMVPIEDTLAAFLVRRNIAFTGDVAVTGFSRDKGTLRVTLTHARENNGGRLTLVFDEAPMRLRLWVVTDAQGVETRVALSDAEFGVALKNELFDIPASRDPAR